MTHALIVHQTPRHQARANLAASARRKNGAMCACCNLHPRVKNSCYCRECVSAKAVTRYRRSVGRCITPDCKRRGLPEWDGMCGECGRLARRKFPRSSQPKDGDGQGYDGRTGKLKDGDTETGISGMPPDGTVKCHRCDWTGTRHELWRSPHPHTRRGEW